MPECALKRWIYNKVSLMAFRILTRSYSGTVRFHQLENRPRAQGVCVANHTPPIDVCILSCDVSYALVSRRRDSSVPPSVRQIVSGVRSGVVRISRGCVRRWFCRRLEDVRTRVCSSRVRRSWFCVVAVPSGVRFSGCFVVRLSAGACKVSGLIQSSSQGPSSVSVGTCVTQRYLRLHLSE